MLKLGTARLQSFDSVQEHLLKVHLHVLRLQAK
jgi:hypothetical protein